MRQPRLAEMIAGRLRDDILSGRLKEGDALGRQEIFTEFRVSLPAMREAMRILETEGLISVRRGNVGGAIVHLPTPMRVAQTISMILQARGTTMADVSGTLAQIEPICAGMCARREDRHETVVPALRTAIEVQEADFDDPQEYNTNARKFHEAIVAHCGSDTMTVMVGALEAIWSAHESSVWREAETPDGTDADAPMAMRTRLRALRDHEKILEAVDNGDAERAMALSAAHLSATRNSTLTSSSDTQVQTKLLSPTGS
ncbi:FadR/GntR family transcriptional regulator [Mycobacterium sp. 94-17]|uniref:FadR/GntR family transcriptional regulator n=1 Tax=Mycobacterium sp. 94-17 TaxID=2986147 RepID=UPI002D1EAF7E|nr:FCD domain-containing protein [Mycobacterium sp. 94-17]MEB4209768.1 FCD domain-containing protein [Mycobacterium sp. 94-17]